MELQLYINPIVMLWFALSLAIGLFIIFIVLLCNLPGDKKKKKKKKNNVNNK